MELTQKTRPFSLLCQQLYFPLQSWKLFCWRFFSLATESWHMQWNIFMEYFSIWKPLFWLPLCTFSFLWMFSSWDLLAWTFTQNEFQRCMSMSPWKPKAEFTQKTCCWDDCLLYPVWAQKQCHVNYLDSHRATAVVMTGRNYFAVDRVRVRIPHDCETILNYSSWKKSNLLVLILLIDKKAELNINIFLPLIICSTPSLSSVLCLRLLIC